MAHLALALLGPFEATLDGVPVEGLGSDRLRALLAYLAVCRRERKREEVASLLWPERSDRDALSALRYALSKLHSALGDRRASSPFLLVTRSTVQFNPASDHWLDVAEFLGLADRQDLPALTRAAELYRGPLLDGLSVGDSPAFEDWVLLTGEEMRRAALSALGRLTSLQLGRGQHLEAARWARRQIELEPYREQGHRHLMVALSLGGERPAALAHYESWRRLLADELGCEPEDETRVLFSQIRDGSLPRPGPVPVILDTSRPASPPAEPRRTRFVARKRESARLGALLDQALSGRGGVVLVSGEAGSGKTALLDELARRGIAERRDLIALRGRCNAHGGTGDPYLPFREMLQTLAGDVEGKRAGGALSPEQARRVWGSLAEVGAVLTEHGPDLIESFVPGRALLQRAEGFPGVSGATRWQARLREILRRAEEGAAPVAQPDLFAQVTQVLHAVSLQVPLLLAIDDLQWADTGTAALLFHLGRRLDGSRILLACAFRPEALDGGDREQAGAPSASTVLQELTRDWGDVLIDLDRADGRAFVEAYVDIEPNRLGPRFREALYGHTGGNPLFTVELLRSFQRDGTLVQDGCGQWVEAAQPRWTNWPPQVEAVIGTHLASLSDEDRALLDAASVQGEQFAAEVVARAVGVSEECAVRRLSGPLTSRHRLVKGLSVDRLAATGQRLSRYLFVHALYQEYLYSDLDAVRRVHLHEEIGRALEGVHGLEAGHPLGDEKKALAPALARHFEAAQMPLEAARYRYEAGQWAARLVSFDEAIAHLERGLELLGDVPAGGEKLRLELALCLAMVDPLLLLKGWQEPALRQTLERLSELVEHAELQNEPQRIAALSTLALQTIWMAQPERGRRVGEQLMQIAQDGDRQTLALAHWALGNSYWTQGVFTPAREHLERALELTEPESGRPLGPVLGADPCVVGRTMLGTAQWFQGFPDQGRGSLEQACEKAEAIGHPPTVLFARMMAALIYSLLGRDPDSVAVHLAVAGHLGEFSAVYDDFEQMLAAQGQGGDVQDGSTGHAGPNPGLGQGAGGVAEARSFPQVGGLGMGGASLLLLQARTLARDGMVPAALQTVDRTIDWMERTGGRAMEADAWRMRGDLLLATDGRSAAADSWPSSSPAEAEACFARALQIARARETRWLELRAAVSLARLWQDQGRREEARELLAGICGWFTEGSDTVDLIEAKALLHELQYSTAPISRTLGFAHQSRRTPHFGCGR